MDLNEKKEYLKAWEEFSTYIQLFIDNEKPQINEIKQSVEKASENIKNDILKAIKQQKLLDETTQKINERLKELTAVFKENDSKLAGQIEKFKEDLNAELVIASDALKKIKATHEQINDALNKYSNISEFIETIDDKIKDISLQPKSSANDDFKERLQNVLELPIGSLYYLFQPKIPFVITNSRWTTQRFVVTNIQNGIFYGKYYRNGQHVKDEGDKLKTGGFGNMPEYTFSIYDGIDKDALIKQSY